LAGKSADIPLKRPDTEDQYNNGKQAIITNGNAYKEHVHAVIVGSESLYRGTYSADELVARIEDMRRAAPGFRYGMSDSWNKYADGTADPVARVSDIVLINAFSYWQGASIDAAVGVFNSDIEQARARVNAAREGRPVETWVGETGWPTEGTTYQAAVPSLANAKRYYDEGVCPMVRGGGNVFVFEAFDEPWKPDSIGDTGQAAKEKHWGVMTADRSEKFGLRC
jgi:glucan 1,3-beta-glucosidase